MVLRRGEAQRQHTTCECFLPLPGMSADWARWYAGGLVPLPALSDREEKSRLARAWAAASLSR